MLTDRHINEPISSEIDYTFLILLNGILKDWRTCAAISVISTLFLRCMDIFTKLQFRTSNLVNREIIKYHITGYIEEAALCEQIFCLQIVSASLPKINSLAFPEKEFCHPSPAL